MAGEIRLGKISSIDYAKGMARVVYHEKDDDVTRLIPLLSHEYKMPPVGSQVLVVHLSNGTEAGVVLGRPWSEKNAPPEGGAWPLLRDFRHESRRTADCAPFLAFSGELAAAGSPEGLLDRLTAFYQTHGVGLLGMGQVFRARRTGDGAELVPVEDRPPVRLADLVGYRQQKDLLIRNTEAFLRGKGSNNVLLYGDAGTGKSTSVKAILNEYADRGLRMIEIYKHQFGLLSQVIAKIKNRNYRFMIFIDDLSFEEHEVEYKFLKAVIEGGVETRPSNVLIVATSNRRHLVQETWKDRDDMEHNGDIHRSDTMEEKLSLAARFGCAICYVSPNRQQYHDIVKGIAARLPDGLSLTEDELLQAANRWEIRHGGVSGRTAQQFINYIAGMPEGVKGATGKPPCAPAGASPCNEESQLR